MRYTSSAFLVVELAVGAGCASHPMLARGSHETAARSALAPVYRASPADPSADPPAVAPERATEPPRDPPAPPWAALDSARTLAEVGLGQVTVVPGRRLPPASPPAFITVLHANCVDSVETCTFLRPIADGRAILVCPKGNVPCNNGGAVWGGTLQAVTDVVEGGIGRAERALGVSAPHEHDILFGSSGGAFAVRNLINTGHTGWSALILVGAKVRLDVAATRRAGIQRVLLAAPDGDMAAPAMRDEKVTLCRAGIPARFVSLGPHGHGMDDASPGILAAQMDWVMGLSDEEGAASGCR